MDTCYHLFQVLSIYVWVKSADGLSTLSAGRRIAEGVPYSLVCTESSVITNNVLFFKSNDNQGGCISSTCGSSVAEYSVTQNTTSTTFHIDSVNGSRESGIWTCQHGTDPKSSPIVIAPPIPSYLNESAITTEPPEGSSISPPQVIVVSIPCASPVAKVTWSYTKDGATRSISASDSTDCPTGQNKMNSSLNTGSIDDTGMITLTVKVEHDSFDPANNYARQFTFKVNLGAPPTSPEATTATPTSTATTPTSSTATTPSTARTTDAPEKIRIYIILGCVGGGVVVIASIIIIFCCCCPSCCHGCCPSCCHSCCPSCCCRESTRKRKDNDGEIRSVTGGENGHTKTTSAKQETQVVMNDYPTSQKTEGDDLEKRMGGVDSEDITITIPDGQSDGMKDDRVPKPDGRSEGGMHRL